PLGPTRAITYSLVPPYRRAAVSRVCGDLSARPPIIASPATSRTGVVGSGTTVIPLAWMDPRAVDRKDIVEANRGTIDTHEQAETVDRRRRRGDPHAAQVRAA